MEDLKELQEQLNSLRKDFEDFKQGQNKSKFNMFEDIKFYSQLKVDDLFIRYVTSTTNDEPSILSNSIALWKDTLATKYYLKANFNGTSKKVELL